MMIAYHFPPYKGSSGVQRTLRFTQHLPGLGWRPVVLSIDPGAYEETSAAMGNEVPPDLKVIRSRGFDTARHLSLFGRYPRTLATPDRWTTWRFDGVRKALQLTRGGGIDAIWSTFPIATAHTIGIHTATRSGLPWIAEFRDPMWQGTYPPDPVVNRSWKLLEERIFRVADAIVVTTPGAAAAYRERFPTFPAERLVVIENGYDEETFQRAEATLAGAPASARVPGRPFTLLHSGVIYRSERDPTALFAALASLKARGVIDRNRLRIVLRASGDDDGFRRDVDAKGIGDIVELEPAIDYLDALQEMVNVDGLLLLQAANCNAQVPAKLYEYLRARRPILALTDPAGDTAKTLDNAGAGLIAPLDSQERIESALEQFMHQLSTDTWRRPTELAVARCSRAARTTELARLLELVRSRPRRLSE